MSGLMTLGYVQQNVEFLEDDLQHIQPHYKNVRMEISDTELVVPLYPVDLGKPLSGVQQYLNEKIDKYYPEVGGILMSYSNIRFREKCHVTYTDLPYIPVKIVMTATVFAPRRGALLTVTVTDVKKDIILCLAADRYNVTVKRESASNPDMMNFPFQQGQRIDVLIQQIFSDDGVVQLKADPLAIVKKKPVKRRNSGTTSDPQTD